MRILHYYPQNNEMIAQHVKMLSEGADADAGSQYKSERPLIHCATEEEQAKTLLQGGHYDILHLHGCWRNSSRVIVNMAMRQGSRLVVTPHGGLEPWEQEENRWKEKWPKLVLYQYNIIRRAYAVIIQGKMENESMMHLGWNPRLVIIKNAVITQSITPKEMVSQTFDVYRKIMNSNQLELMDDDTRKILKALITVGITGDKRWLDLDDEYTGVSFPTISADHRWHLLLCYAHQEDITDTLQRGIRILGLDAPDIDVEKTDYYLPAGYTPVETIGKTIGYKFATENERLLATFRLIRKLVSSRQLSIKHLIEVDRELRQHACNEELLADELKEQRLWKLASRVLQVTNELTGLPEGYMPIAPLDDGTTRSIRKQVDERLKIKY